MLPVVGLPPFPPALVSGTVEILHSAGPGRYRAPRRRATPIYDGI